VNFSVQLEFVGDQHLAAEAQAAGLPQQHEAEGVDMDDQRDLPEPRRSVTSGAPREPFIAMRVQNK
jgi:hypothetical protein